MAERPDPRPSRRPTEAAEAPAGDAAGRPRSGLASTLLIAMPGMRDPRFERAVVFLCENSAKGSMGLVINRPSEEVGFAELARHLGVEVPSGAPVLPVHIGGPVEPGRGFVLHSADYERPGATLRVGPRYGMTATVDVLREIAAGSGPARALLALGYAGWAPGQLEAEIAANAWLTAEAVPETVFDLPAPRKWGAALAALGVDPIGLSAVSGRA